MIITENNPDVSIWWLGQASNPSSEGTHSYFVDVAMVQKSIIATSVVQTLKPLEWQHLKQASIWVLTSHPLMQWSSSGWGYHFSPMVHTMLCRVMTETVSACFSLQFLSRTSR